MRASAWRLLEQFEDAWGYSMSEIIKIEMSRFIITILFYYTKNKILIKHFLNIPY